MTITASEPPAAGIAVSMLGISKSFGATTALADVDLQLRSGEIHALLGENGAGKTTLMRILAGLDTPDGGTVAIDGVPVEQFEPRVLLERGIALVQQHFTLVPRFTAGQNLVLAARRRGRLPSRREAASRLDRLTERFGLPVRNDVAAGHLSVGEQQRLELLRALDRDPRVLILDEPTAVLTELEADRLLEVCRCLAAEGRTVVLISHRLREVVAGADRVTVLRTGSVVVGGELVGDHDRASLARAMIGADGVVSRRHEGAARAAGTVRLDLDGVRAGRLEPLHLEVHRGEVVGVAGVDGNGQTELEAIVAARRPPDEGSVAIDGRPLAVGRPRLRIRSGVAYIAADRYRYALVRALSLGDNLGLGRTPAWRPRKGRRDDAARCRLDEWDVRGPRRGLVGQLSGGNAQKLVLARELAGAPSVILAAQPTRGLDPGAAAAVATRLLGAAASGSAVLWISAELDELLAVSDRLVVLCTGHAPASFTPPWDRHAIGMAMAGVDADGVGQSAAPGGVQAGAEALR